MKLLAIKTLQEEREKEELLSLNLNMQLNLEEQHFSSWKAALRAWRQRLEASFQRREAQLSELAARHNDEFRECQTLL